MGDERGGARVLRANRAQLQLRPFDLDATLAADHRARLIWKFAERLDLSRFYAKIEARECEPGRPAIDPLILFVLWLFATSEGVGSARRVARLCDEHDAYRWICGDVSVNYHTLSDFRVDHAAEIDELMTQVLGVLMHQGLVDLSRIAQDGVRVRASAGAGSFRRKGSLERCLEEARQHLEAVKREAEDPDGKRSAAEKAATERAAREQTERLERALAEMPKAEAAKKAKDREDARVSTTDPEARVMKMGDGGFRPAFNVQFATDTENQVIVGVGVSNVGSDMGQLTPMLDQIQRRAGELPKEHLVDGGFTKCEAIEDAAAKGVTVFAPVPASRKEGVDPHEPKEGDSEVIAQWRSRMATDEAKEIYRERGATAERVNADLRTWRGLTALPVRGTDKVLSVALWMALTYNVLRWISLGGAA